MLMPAPGSTLMRTPIITDGWSTSKNPVGTRVCGHYPGRIILMMLKLCSNVPVKCTGIPHFTVFHCIALCRYCSVVFCLSVFVCLQIEGFWQPHVEQVYWSHFSNSICSFCVWMSHFGNSEYFTLFHYYIC